MDPIFTNVGSSAGGERLDVGEGENPGTGVNVIGTKSTSSFALRPKEALVVRGQRDPGLGADVVGVGVVHVPLERLSMLACVPVRSLWYRSGHPATVGQPAVGVGIKHERGSDARRQVTRSLLIPASGSLTPSRFSRNSVNASGVFDQRLLRSGTSFTGG